VERRAAPRLRALDGLRGIAALGVLVWHVLDRVAHDVVAPATAASPLIANLGKYGVSLFFVLSGFLLARPLLAWLLGERARPDFARYLRARVLRIVPAWLLVVAVVVPIARPDLLRAPADLLQLATLSYMSFDPEPVRYVVPQSWTLTIELAVYLTLPLVAILAAPFVRRVPQAWRGHVLAAGLGGIVLFSIVWQHVMYQVDGRPLHDVRPLNHLVPVFADHFALGGLVALAVLLRRGPAGRAAAALGAVVFLGGAVAAERVDVLRPESRSLVAAGLALAVLAAATARGGRVAGALAGRPAVHAGQRSYAIYLWHYPLLEAAAGLGLTGAGSSPVPVIAGLAVASLIAAEISWRLVEAPALARIDRPGRDGPRDTSARPSPTMARHAVSLDRAPAR
jgi:peptidoglycan/LPS O-acetylase OafA/YrhL